MYTSKGPTWKMAWSMAKPTVAPAATVAVEVDAPELAPAPVLQRRSEEVVETGELALVLRRTYWYSAVLRGGLAGGGMRWGGREGRTQLH